MDAYMAEIRNLENMFSGLEIHHVDRVDMWELMSSPSSDLLEPMYH